MFSASAALLDTDVLIDALRVQPQAVKFINSLPELVYVSAATVAELFAGVREGAERSSLEKLIRSLEVIPISMDVAQAGGLLRRDFAPSHGVGIMDAMIAATCMAHRLVLHTLNAKHFPMLPKHQLKIPYKKQST